jgi:hypothetical protein
MRAASATDEPPNFMTTECCASPRPGVLFAASVAIAARTARAVEAPSDAMLARRFLTRTF